MTSSEEQTVEELRHVRYVLSGRAGRTGSLLPGRIRSTIATTSIVSVLKGTFVTDWTLRTLDAS